ncbi:MAG: GNAT family N-acetyltransferase [Rubrivivax sp.]
MAPASPALPALRALRADDAPAYRALMLEAYASHPDAFTSTVDERAPLPLAWWAARLSGSAPAPETVWGAFDPTTGALVGAAGLRFETRPRLAHKCTLFGMFVRTAARGQGAGRQLVDALLRAAAERSGVRLVQLTVSEGNAGALALYRRCGFEPIGREPAANLCGDRWVTKLHLWHTLGVPASTYENRSPTAPAAAPPVRQRVLDAVTLPPRARASNYPPPFAERMAGREKRALGDAFGLTHFGVNLTRLAPGAASALRHAHSAQDEFVFVLQGRPTLHDDAGSTTLGPGQCIGFPAGAANAHRLHNAGTSDAWMIEIGDRTPGDCVRYPDDDLRAEWRAGAWHFVHHDGRTY